MKHQVLISIGLSCALAMSAFVCANGGEGKSKRTDTKRQAASRSREEIERGKRIYNANQCSACHSIAGEGCKDGVALDGIASRRSRQFIREHLRDPEKHAGKNPQAFGGDPNLMPSPNLSEEEIRSITTYLLSLPSQKKGKK
ncbi:MAG TPA: cytochrome c [Candidatus Obscuribacterales bacterium]